MTIPNTFADIGEIRSNAEMRKLMERKIVAQSGACTLCKGPFTDYKDVVPDHINPRGMGGAWSTDHLKRDSVAGSAQ